jgi:hypothetical protein
MFKLFPNKNERHSTTKMSIKVKGKRKERISEKWTGAWAGSPSKLVRNLYLF